MVNTVGLIGHNGLVGKPTLASLAKLHQEGSIKLVVLHRSGSDTTLIPAGVEARAIDFEAEDGASFDKAVQGINILLSTVGSAGLSSQTKLLPALSRSSDFVTFIPSEFGSNWTEHDFKIANLGFLKAKENVIHEAKNANVAVTFVQAGLFTDIGFNFPIFGWDIKENSIWVYRQSQDSALPVLSVEYLGKALAELVKRDASSLANKGFQVYDFGATGKEVAAALTDIHGKDTKLVEVSDEELKKSLQADHPFVALGAAIVRKRGDNDAGLQGERIEVPGWKSEGLKAAIKNALDKL